MVRPESDSKWHVEVIDLTQVIHITNVFGYEATLAQIVKIGYHALVSQLDMTAHLPNTRWANKAWHISAIVL